MNPIRARIEAALDGTGAFLRCDRGSALYVSDLPARNALWRERLAALDGAVLWRAEGPLVFFTPTLEWAERLDERLLERVEPGELTRRLERRRLYPVCEEEKACWLEGLRRLELPRGASDYERTLRQCAAVALRKRAGGLLFSCGLCLDMIEEMVR